MSDMAHLYLMRHGQTLFNSLKMIQGWCDSPLTELGVQQAKAAADYFCKNGITFDHAYSSTSERACDTLEIVTGGTLRYERLKGLKEWNFGRFEAQSEFLNPPLPYGDFFKYAGGEGESEVKERIVSTIRSIMQREHHESVLVVTHGGALANFSRAFDQYAAEGARFRSGIKNCSIFHYEWNGTYFKCLEIIEVDVS